MLARIVSYVRTFACRRRGTVAIQIGILSIVLIGMAGLGIEIPFLMYKQRQLQNAADSAALSAVVALVKGYPSPSIEAAGVAAQLGYANGIGGVSVRISNPPQSGSYVKNTSAVEVIVSQMQTLVMAGALGVSQYNVSARTVALGGVGGYCVLVLDPASSGAMRILGPAVTMNNCGIAVNSQAKDALKVSIAASLTAPSVSVVGNYTIDPSSTMNVNSLKVGQLPVADPYAGLSMPASTGCDYNSLAVSQSASVTTLQPGRYCNGLRFNPGARVFLAPGIYYVKGGQFYAGSGATVTGYGVTIVLTNMDGCTSYATVSIQNPAALTLSAPSYGSSPGILFFGDRNAPASNFNMLWTNATVNLAGAVYLPTQFLKYNGTGSFSGCHQVIAWQFQILPGDVMFDNTCSNTGMLAIGGANILVE